MRTKKQFTLATAAVPVTGIQPTVPLSNREIKTRRVGPRNGMKMSDGMSEKDFVRQILGETMNRAGTEATFIISGGI
jgi:hypothetical protein